MKAPSPLRHLHYPSVFAIDQYHVSDEIRDKANFMVDGVNVALRLWDTFGDHGMNRKYAYQNAHVVELKEVSSYSSFLVVVEYLYTGHCPVLSLNEALDVIGLANFFCLSRLVASCEQLITKDLQVTMATHELSVAEDVIACLIEAQLHNASQLEGWCFSYIANHYGDVCRKHPKEFKMLSPATHRSLNQQRWPPIWYLIENDWYEKAKREMDQQDKTKHALKSVVKKKKCHCL
ncbi:hypothetical protein QZH41_018156 [Actinostola sp. cb2023]|nr:hypothetical protein QZH41_018156 [Actinostola sp. cb2023]